MADNGRNQSFEREMGKIIGLVAEPFMQFLPVC